MKRIKTKEIHENARCPELFRDSLTEFLSIIWTVGVYRQAIEKISLIAKAVGVRYIVDLCSGAGDYIPSMLKQIKADDPKSSIVIYKTDLYPNKKFFASDDPQIEYFREPLKADCAFSKFDALFCMFSALHHFDEPDLLKIFCRAARNGKCFAFFDISQRRLFTDIIPNIFLPGMLWLSAPFFKHFTWKHFVFIYLVPLIPLTVFVDGVLSRMRAYRQGELEALLKRVRKRYPDFHVAVTEYQMLGGVQKITEITGYPRKYAEKVDELARLKKAEAGKSAPPETSRC